jgi:hypothetical protein
MPVVILDKVLREFQIVNFNDATPIFEGGFSA